MFDINLLPLFGTDDISGNVMVGGQYHTCCFSVWQFLLFKLFLNLSFGFLFSFVSGLFFMLAVWLLLSDLKCPNSLNSFQVDLNDKY